MVERQKHDRDRCHGSISCMCSKTEEASKMGIQVNLELSQCMFSGMTESQLEGGRVSVKDNLYTKCEQRRSRMEGTRKRRL